MTSVIQWLQLYFCSRDHTFLHPPEKQVDRCLRLQLSIYTVTLVICLYCDFSYLPMQSFQLSTYAVISVIYLYTDTVTSVIYLYSDFNYLPIQWLQLSTYAVTSVILSILYWYLSIAETTRFLCPPEKQAYSCLRLQLFICSRDHKISTSSWEADRQVSVTSVIYLRSNFSYLSMLWLQLSVSETKRVAE